MGRKRKEREPLHIRSINIKRDGQTIPIDIWAPEHTDIRDWIAKVWIENMLGVQLIKTPDGDDDVSPGLVN